MAELWEKPEFFGPWENAIFLDSLSFDMEMANDVGLQGLFHDALFNTALETDDINQARDDLKDWMREHYDIEDYWEDFDWEWYQVWYETQ